MSVNELYGSLLKVTKIQQSVMTRGLKFLVIGGGSTLLRFITLSVLSLAGVSVVMSNLASLGISVWFNYSLHFSWTWNDRIPKGQVWWQKVTTYIVLCAVFFACTGITISIKSIFVPWFNDLTGQLLIAAAIGEVIGLPINYLTADKISFGWMVKVAVWLNKSFAFIGERKSHEHI